MTHDELLAKIDNGYLSVTDENSYYKSALRAVVELHKPEIYEGGFLICIECRDDEFPADYPCQTIQAIEKELQ